VVSESAFFISLAGFLASLVLLLYFTSRFRECVASGLCGRPLIGTELEPAETVAPSSAASIIGEISDFKLQLDEMKILIDERKGLHEKQINDIIRNINGIVDRLENVEPQYLEEIQPSLQMLISELEQVRTPGKAVHGQS